MFRTKWNSMGLPENPFPLILFFNEELISLKSIKGQFWSLAVLILWLSLKINLERILLSFFKPAKKVDFGQNKTNLGVKTDVTLVWEIILKLLLSIYSNKLHIKIYCVVLYLKQSLIAALSALEQFHSLMDTTLLYVLFRTPPTF